MLFFCSESLLQKPSCCSLLYSSVFQWSTKNQTKTPTLLLNRICLLGWAFPMNFSVLYNRASTVSDKQMNKVLALSA